jgi:hypothetical protein
MKLSFWWKSILKLLTTYKRFAQAEAGTGETILFWKDMWNGQFLQSIFPELYSFASNENITLSTVLHQEACMISSIFLSLKKLTFNIVN